MADPGTAAANHEMSVLVDQYNFSAEDAKRFLQTGSEFLKAMESGNRPLTFEADGTPIPPPTNEIV